MFAKIMNTVVCTSMTKISYREIRVVLIMLDLANSVRNTPTIKFIIIRNGSETNRMAYLML